MGHDRVQRGKIVAADINYADEKAQEWPELLVAQGYKATMLPPGAPPQGEWDICLVVVSDPLAERFWMNVGGNDTIDSDADAAGNVGVPSAGNGDVNVTFDFGLMSGANVRISKTGPATALPGAAVTYSLSYANDGAASAQNVTVVDTLPAGVSFVSANPAPSSVSGQVITWNLGTLAIGTSGSITVNVRSSSGRRMARR